MSAISMQRAEVDRLIETAYPVYESVKPQVEGIKSGVNSLAGRDVGMVAQLFVNTQTALTKIDGVMNHETVEKVKEFFVQHLQYLPNSQSPYRSSEGVDVDPSNWAPVHFLSQLQDKSLPSLFERFRAIASARQELTDACTQLRDKMGFNQKDASSQSESSPSFIVEHFEPFSVGSSSVESISPEQNDLPRRAPDSITNLDHKLGWIHMETMRVDCANGKSERDLKLTMRAMRGVIRREIYKAMAVKQGITNPDEAAKWGTSNWSKQELRQDFNDALDVVQAKIEAHQVLAPVRK